MARLLISAATALLAMVVGLRAEDAKAPAGYVIAAALKGKDRDCGTSVIRAGQELRPRIWMPLYAGDIVFVRDAASQLILDMGDEGRIELGGSLTRFEADGEIETGDDAWTLISRIGKILAGGGETVVPTNLVSKGIDRFTALSAASGPNFLLRDGSPVHVAWRGGRAPYRLTLVANSRQRELVRTLEAEAELIVPPETPRRFDIVIADAAGVSRRLAFRFRDALPPAPASLAAAGPSKEFDEILLAAWLAERPRGAWRLEALRRLRAMRSRSQAARLLWEAETSRP